MKIRLAYVNGYLDRHGKPRYYFRRPGLKRLPLPGLPGSDEFMAAYQAALAGSPASAIGADRLKPGTVAAVVADYLASDDFRAYSDGTRRARRFILERFRAQHGNKRIALLHDTHIVTILAGKSPVAKRHFLKALRGLVKHCIAARHLAADPSAGITVKLPKTSGYYSWTEDDIAAFEAQHPIGTRARLALALLLYTAQRRGDVVLMGRQHIRGGAFHVRQGKTGAQLQIPIHPRLAELLATTRADHLTFLTTHYGQPFSTWGFGNWFREVCDEAGLPQCSAHGLRKAACRRLAEAGCSENVIAAISGHATMREVERYTRAASQARMAADGMAAVARAFPVKKRTSSD